MLPSLSGLTLKDRPVATTGVNPDEPGSPSGAKPFETEADAMMDELKDIENSVERANQASANALQAVQSATTAKQAYQKLSREAERAQKRHQKAMEQEIEEGLLMTHTEDWFAEKEGMRAELMREIAMLMHQGSFAPPWNNPKTEPGGHPDWPMTTDQRKHDTLIRNVIKAYKELETTATSIKQIGDDRKALRLAQELLERDFQKRKLLVEQRKNPKNLIRSMLARRRRKADFAEWDSAEARRQRRLEIQNKLRLREKEKREEAAAAAVEAAKEKEKAEEAMKVKEEACNEALGNLHMFRDKLKKMADKIAKNIRQAQENCRTDPLEQANSKWMVEMFERVDELRGWIEHREQEDPVGWDVDGHNQAVDESDADSDDDDSDSDSGSDDGSFVDSGSDDDDGEADEFVAMLKKEKKKRGKNKEAQSEYAQAMEMALTEEEYEGFMAFDDDWEAYEASIHLYVDASEAQNPYSSNPSVALVERAVTELLREINGLMPVNYDMPLKNAIVSYFKQGVLSVQMTITQQMYEDGKIAGEGQETPRAMLHRLMLTHWSTEKWSQETGLHVSKIDVGGRVAGYPEFTQEEADFLDRRSPGWFTAPYLDRLILQEEARLAVKEQTIEGALNEDPPTAEEQRQVYEMFRDRGWPEDWFTNPEFANELPASEKLRVLMILRDPDRFADQGEDPMDEEEDL